MWLLADTAVLVGKGAYRSLGDKDKSLNNALY